MTKIMIGAILLLGTSTCVRADIFTWGPTSLSDNAAGSFLTGFNITTLGPKWFLVLPAFSQDGTFDFPGPSEVSLSVSVSDTASLINGVRFTYDGVIDQTGGPASVDFSQTVVGSPGSPLSGNFAATPFSGTLTHSVTNHLDLSLVLDLHDSGGSASINKIEFDITQAPEPSYLLLLATMLGIAVSVKHRFT